MTVLKESFEKQIVEGMFRLSAYGIKECILGEIKDIRFPHFYVGTADSYEIEKHPELVPPMGKKAIVIKKGGIRIDKIEKQDNSIDLDLEDRVYLLQDGLYTFKMRIFNVKIKRGWESGSYPLFESKEENLKNYVLYWENIIEGIRRHKRRQNGI